MRYQKDVKVRLYEQRYTQDDEGGQHAAYVNLGEYWAHYRPVAISKEQGVAMHEIADICLTINKPAWFSQDTYLVDLFTVWQGRAFSVTRIEDIEGKARGDVRLYMRREKNLTPADIEARLVEP